MAKWADAETGQVLRVLFQGPQGDHISLDKAKPGESSLAFVGDMGHSWYTWKHGAGRLRELNLDSDVMGEGERREL